MPITKEAQLNWNKKKKKAKKKEISSTKLDKLWSEYIKDRAKRKCEYCGSNSYLNAHHIFSRSNYTLRWNIDNGICLCAKHHVFGNFSAHKSPLEFGEWVKENRGVEWYERLLMAYRDIWDKDREKVLSFLTSLKAS